MDTSFGRSLPMMLFRALDAVLPELRVHLATFGLTEPQWRVMRLLWIENGQSVSQLAHSSLMETSAVVGVIDRLEKAELVKRERSEHDRRRVNVHLTPSGAALEAEVVPVIDACMARLELALEPHQWRALYGALDRLIADAFIQETKAALAAGGGPPLNENVATCLEVISDRLRDTVALASADRKTTWGEFDDRAARVATGLESLGLAADGKVALYLFNCPEYLEAAYAAFKLRACPINVNYRFVSAELTYMLDNSDSTVLIFDSSLAEHAVAAAANVDHDVALIEVGPPSGSPGTINYEDLIRDSVPAKRIKRSGSDHMISYTGGTTGLPKGVVSEHRNLLRGLGESYRAIGSTPPLTLSQLATAAADARVTQRSPGAVAASPLMHGVGFATAMTALLLGGQVTLLPSRRFDADELWLAVERSKAQWIAIVGDAFARPMVESLERAEAAGRPFDLSSVKIIASSGMAFSNALKEEIVRRGSMMILDNLASTESPTVASTITAPGSVGLDRFTVGPNTRVFDEQDRDVRPGSGDVGLLAVCGNLPLGYYKDPERTERTFRTIDGERYVFPGDWARVESDGSITLLGRGSVCINTGGEKVFPEEVEQVLRLHPAVADCLVVGVPDPKWGEVVGALIALTPGASVTDSELSEWPRTKLAGYKCPRRIRVVSEIVRGPAGKADYNWGRTAIQEATPEFAG